MVTCYNCGKLLLDRKVMGLCEDRMHTFCSERCRSAAWSSDEKKSAQIHLDVHIVQYPQTMKQKDFLPFTSTELNTPTKPKRMA